MQAAPKRANEAESLVALMALDVLDSEPEAEFDALVRAAAIVCGVPVSLISLIDAERQWFKASTGLAGVKESALDVAFCAHVVLSDDLFEVPDAMQDARFADNPFVTGRPDIRFYAGAPLILSDGTRVGTLCVIDHRPRQLDETQREVLRQLSVAAARALEGRRAMRKVHAASAEVARVGLELQRSATELRLGADALREAQRLGRIGSWEWQAAADVVKWSEELYGILGCDPTQPAPTYIQHSTLYVGQSWTRLKANVERALRTGEPYALELEFAGPNGRKGWVDARGEAIRGVHGQIVGLRGTIHEITEQRQLRTDLAHQHELLRVTLKSIGDAVITTDAAGHVDWLNPAAERMTGWLTTEAHGRPLTQVFHAVDETTREPAADPVAACLARGASAAPDKHTLLLSRSGGEFGIEDSAAPIRNEAGDVLGVVLVFHDVSEQRRMAGEMTYRATHDALTGLVNRAEFETRLMRLLRNAHENHSEHALLYIDLDQFKLVNDACGHAIGDQLLKQVSRLLGEAIRARDTLARLGGDEFAIMLEHCTAEQAQRVAQKVCDRMEDFRFIHDGRRFRIGASIGLVPVDSRWVTTAAIMQAADTSCYAAKEAGRNRVHAWFDTDKAMQARQGEMQWATRIEQALDEDRFVLFAQRIESLREASLGLHAEVLLRMVDSQGALIPPGAFLPAAERFNLASRIDRWVLRHAIDWMKALPSQAVVENLSVNLSGQSVGDRSFHRWASELLADAGASICARLCLEITETAAVTNLADAALFIEQVRAAGVRVALDDFGAGASSFGYLKRLPVDYLKIDGQFIRDLVTDPLDDAAVRCFADVARVVGMKTIAEFVDQPAVLGRLREIGIDFAQGFLLHRPEPLDALLSAPILVADRH
jgi:diguanylate cyclase (GGDEF)-like protein/PAS domain S-box-containing protein